MRHMWHLRRFFVCLGTLAPWFFGAFFLLALALIVSAQQLPTVNCVPLFDIHNQPVTLCGPGLVPVTNATPTPVVSPTGGPSQTPMQSPSPTPTPTYGPLSLLPNALSFVLPTDAPQTVAISETFYNGAFNATPPPGGFVTISVSGNVLTVTPIAVGSGTITIYNVTDPTKNGLVQVGVATAVPSPTIPPTAPPTVVPTPNIRITGNAIFVGINNPAGGVPALEAQVFTPPSPGQSPRVFAIHLIYPGWTDLQHINDSPCPNNPISAQNACQYAQADKAAGRIPNFAWNCGDLNANVAAGNDDTMLQNTAKAVAAFNYPVMIRWLWEMNLGGAAANHPTCYDGPDGSPTGNDNNGPDGINGSTGTAGFFDGPTYAAAYQHIWNVFNTAGVTNATWVFNPGNGNGSIQYAYMYFPGSSYVDWLAQDTYDRSDSGPAYLLDHVAPAYPYPVPGKGNWPNATPYPIATPTTNSAYKLLTSLDLSKPYMIDENGAHPDLNNSTPPPGGYTGAYQQVYFSGGAMSSPWPVTAPYASLDTVVKQHPALHAYVYFDKNNSPNPPPVGGDDWLIFNTASTGPFGQFVNGPYESLPAIPPPPAPPVFVTETPASSSDAVVDSIGVNTHCAGYAAGFFDCINPNGTNDALATLGVRHYRDTVTDFWSGYGNIGTPDFPSYGSGIPNTTWYNALAANAGLTLDAVLPLSYGLHQSAVSQTIAAVPSIDAVEIGGDEPDSIATPSIDPCPVPNPNKYSCWAVDSNAQLAYYGIGGAAGSPYTVDTLGRKLLGASILDGSQYTCSSVPVSKVIVVQNGCPVAGANDLTVPGNQAATMQLGNLHNFTASYPGGGSAKNPPLAKYQQDEQAYAFGLPDWVTETGYGTSQDFLADSNISRFEPRIYLNALVQGIKRTYRANLLDCPTAACGTYYNSFGLVAVDPVAYTETPKLQYNTLRNFISLYNDPGPVFAPQPIQWAIQNSDSQTEHYLTQRQDGSYELAIWEEATGLTSTPTVTLSFYLPYFQTVVAQKFNPTTGDYTNTPLVGTVNGNTITYQVQVQGAVTVLRLSTNASYAAPTPLLAPTPWPVAVATPTPLPFNNTLCVGGSAYQTTFDDEFQKDNALSLSPTQYNATTAPNSGAYSTYIANIGFNSRTNNGGSDDAYYTDATQGFGGYNPFIIGNGQPLQIHAIPVPAPYATTPALTPGDGYTRHWLSGVLTRPGKLYGYYEVAAKEPNLQGFWPAPLWLLGAGSYNGKSQPYPLATPVADLTGIQEIDVNELFGNALGPSNVQQTLIYGYEPNPTPTPPTPALSQHVNTVVSPDPGASYHTYGVLILPGYVSFYIDRVPKAQYPATPEGNMNIMMQLQVFANGAFGGTTSGPASSTPQSIYYTYYREYTQNAQANCGSAPVLTAATPAPTPAPSPSVASSAITIAQTGATFNNAAAPAAVVPTLPTAPTAGHMLLMIGSIFNPITPPTGWTALDAGPELAVDYCIVGGGTGQCPAATSYNFSGNGAIAKIFDLAGTNTAYAPVISTDSTTYNGIVSRSLLIPQTGGLTFDAYAAYTSSNSGGVTSITDALSPGQTEANTIAVVNQGATTGALSLSINKLTSETFQVPAQTLNATGTVAQTTQYAGSQFYNGAIISILATGTTPAATPQPYPSPSYPAQPSPAPTTTPTPIQTPVPTPTPTPTIAPSLAYAAPTITPEPLYNTNPTTTSFLQSNVIVNGIGIDTGITQSHNFSVQAPFLCGYWPSTQASLPWNPAFTCLQHVRDGLFAGNGEPYIADMNYLGTLGIGNFYIVNSGDSPAALTAANTLYTNVDAVGPPNEPNSNQFGAYLSNVSNLAGIQINVAIRQGNQNALPYPKTKVLVGEGPTQEATVISTYSSNTAINFTTALIQAHKGGVSTTLAANYTGPVSVPPNTIPPIPAGAPPTVPTPLPTAVPPPTPSGPASNIVLSNATNIAAGDYLSFGCISINAGVFNNYEVAQVASSYTGGTTVPLNTTLRYSHSSNESVVEGCIRRVNDNAWGAVNDSANEINFIHGLTSYPVYNVGYAFPQISNGESALYGGTPPTLGSYARDQIHGYCNGNCGGAWGDGSLGFGNNHPVCFLLNCNTASWQYNISAAWAEGGSGPPADCTECGWPIVPVGAPASTTPTNYASGLQIPDDVAAAWEPRQMLFMLSHGFSRMYNFTLLDGSGSGFCTYGLIRSTGCGGTSGYGIASGQQPKAAYNALTDLIGLLNDAVCLAPGCSFTTDTFTWGWSALPSVNHTNSSLFRGTDPGQVRSVELQKSNGDILIPYWYEATDYLQSQSTGCQTTTNCYQWGGNASNSSPNGNQYTMATLGYYITGSHAWNPGCFNIDTDLNPTDYSFGHMIPTSAVNWSTNDFTTLAVKPEVQILYCPSASTGYALKPLIGGSNPSPTPIPGEVTPEPTPLWNGAATLAQATAVPTGFQATPPPSPSPSIVPTPAITPALVQTPLAAQVAGSSISITYAATPLPNDILKADLSFAGSNVPVIPPAGWQQIYGRSANTLTLRSYVHVMQLNDPTTWTWTMNTSDFVTLTGQDFLNAGAPFVYADTNVSGATVTTPLVTPPSPGSLAFGVFSQSGNKSATAGPGYTLTQSAITNPTQPGTGFYSTITEVGTPVSVPTSASLVYGAAPNNALSVVWMIPPSTTAQATPGPLTLFPTSVSFPLSNSPGQLVTISDPNFTGSFTATAPPVSSVTVTQANNVLTIVPVPGATGSGVIAVSDGVRTQNESFNVVATPTPMINPMASPGSIVITGQAFPKTVTNTVNLTAVTNGAAAPNYCWAVWGFGTSLFDTKSSCANVISNYNTTGSATLTQNTKPAPPYLTWTDGQPDTTGAGSVYPQLTTSGTTTGFGFVINQGSTAYNVPNTVNLVLGAYCANVSLVATTSDNTPITTTDTTFTDNGTGTNHLYHIVYATTASASHLNINAMIASNPCAAGSTPSLGLQWADFAPTLVAIPTLPPATPGPLALGAASVTFANPAAAPTTVAISDPNNTTTFTAVVSSGTSSSVTVTGNTATGVLTVTPVVAGSSVITISDSFNSVTLPVTVGAAVATPTPAPFFSFSSPYPGLNAAQVPITYTGLLTPSSMTGIINVKGGTTTNGSQLMSFLGAWSLDGGLINGQPNAQDATGYHIYQNGPGSQASAANQLTALSTYMVAFTVDGPNNLLTLYTCPAKQTCVANQVTTPSGFVYSAQTLEVGAADQAGTIRVANADLWGGALTQGTMTAAQIQALANVQIPDPYPSPVINPTQAYPPPRPQFPNAYAVITRLPSSIDPKFLREYSTKAWQYYDALIKGTAPNEPSSGFQHTDDQPSNDYVTTGTNLFTYTGTGMYIASDTDPVYDFSCFTGAGCYVGWTLPMNNVHVPYGARTQNAGIGGCDCHLFLIEPLHWVPQNVSGKTVWPDVYPYQYELDIIGANNGSAGPGGCQNDSHTSCTIFNGNALPAVNTGYIYAQGVFTTATIGWGGASLGKINDGMAPGPEVSNIDGQNYDGSGTSGDYAQHAFSVSAQEIANGSINHATSGYWYCLQNVNSGGLPGKPFSDSLCDGNFAQGPNGDQRSGSGGNIDLGFGYGDLVTLDPTQVTDASLDADTALNYVQRIWIKSLLHYGYYPGDTTKPYQGMLGFGPYIWGADPLWKTIGQQHNLPTSNQYGDPAAVQVNMWLPERYYKYLMALDPCIISKQPC